MPTMGDLAAVDGYDPFDTEAAWKGPNGLANSPGVARGQQYLADRIRDLTTVPTVSFARPERSPDDQVAHRTPYGDIYQSDLDKANDLALSFSGGGLATKAVKPGAVKPAAASATPPPAQQMGGVLNVPVLGPTSDVSLAAPYLRNPQRIANPGVYKRPDVIAAEAA